MKTATLLFATGAAILGSLISLGLTAWAPTLSLSGSSSVAPGGRLALHGSSFLPYSSVTLTLDNGAPLPFSQHAAPPQLARGYGQTGANVGQIAQALLSPRASNVVVTQGNGTFNIFLQIDTSLSIGQHIIHATEAQTHRSVSRSFTVIRPTPVIASAATVTATPASQQVNNTFTITAVPGTPGARQVQARILAATTQTVSRTVNATGQGTTSGTHATGTLIMFTQYSPITVTAGSVYPCNVSGGSYCTGQIGSLHVVVDQTVTIGANTSMSGIPAHIQEVGPISNVQWGFNYADSNMRINIDQSFTGGTDPQPYTHVQQSDIDNAANQPISANQPDAQQLLQGQVQANERSIGTPQCAPNTSANPQAGGHAATVTVSVNFTCTGEVYDYNGTLELSKQLLKNQAANSPGYSLIGQIIPTFKSASLSSQTIILTVAAKGVWVYQISTAQQQEWAIFIAGESPQTAQALLIGQESVVQVTIQLVGAHAQVLPTNPQQITIVVQTVQGL